MQLGGNGVDSAQAKIFHPAEAAAPLMSEATIFLFETSILPIYFLAPKLIHVCKQ